MKRIKKVKDWLKPNIHSATEFVIKELRESYKEEIFDLSITYEIIQGTNCININGKLKDGRKLNAYISISDVMKKMESIKLTT